MPVVRGALQVPHICVEKRVFLVERCGQQLLCPLSAFRSLGGSKKPSKAATTQAAWGGSYTGTPPVWPAPSVGPSSLDHAGNLRQLAERLKTAVSGRNGDQVEEKLDVLLTIAAPSRQGDAEVLVAAGVLDAILICLSSADVSSYAVHALRALLMRDGPQRAVWDAAARTPGLLEAMVAILGSRGGTGAHAAYPMTASPLQQSVTASMGSPEEAACHALNVLLRGKRNPGRGFVSHDSSKADAGELNNLKQRTVAAGAIPLLAHCLRSSHVSLQLASLEVSAELVHESDGSQRAFLTNAGALEAAVACLGLSQQAATRQGLLVLVFRGMALLSELSQAAERDAELRNRMVQAGALQAMLQCTVPQYRPPDVTEQAYRQMAQEGLRRLAVEGVRRLVRQNPAATRELAACRVWHREGTTAKQWQHWWMSIQGLVDAKE